MKKIIIVIVALIAGILSGIFSFTIFENKIPINEDYDALYSAALKFDEQYRNPDSSEEALAFANDTLKEDGVFKVLLENKKCYVTLYYDEDRNFLKGDMRAKIENKNIAVLYSFLIGALVSAIAALIFSYLYYIKISKK